MDRIDLQVEVQPVSAEKLISDGCAESSQAIRERVEVARTIQNLRYRGEYSTNAQIPAMDLKKHCKTGQKEMQFLRTAISKLNLSARAYSRILKVARTIADLDGGDFISLGHLSEALLYRGFDRKTWHE